MVAGLGAPSSGARAPVGVRLPAPGSPLAASLTPAPPPLPLPPGARPQLQRVQALPFRRCGLVCTDGGREMVEWGGPDRRNSDHQKNKFCKGG